MHLKTARLSLDALEPADAPALFACRSQPEVARYQRWRPADEAAVAAFIAAQPPLEPMVPGWQQRAIRLPGGELVGDLGLCLPEPPGGTVELGISIAPAWQRRGFAAEMLRAVLACGFGSLGWHRVQASVDPRNRASVALLESIGLRREGHFRESLWWDGAWADDVIYALLAREWGDDGLPG